MDLGHELAIPLCGLSAVITRLLATRAGWSILAASAVGMTHPSRIASLGGIATVGAVLGILLLGLQTMLVGLGGALGACACVLGYISLEQLKK
ncbi:MAG: hypothetical protein ACO37Y_04490 [Steroidobacteraceae bacterium]